MKAKVIDTEEVGKAIFDKADGASIEEMPNNIKEDIAEAANKPKDKEYHDRAISIIEGSIECAKEANQTVAEFVRFQVKEILKKEIDCFCPYCMMKTVESITEEDIAKYGKENVNIICDGFATTLRDQMNSVMIKVNDKLRWIKDGNHATKSYEDMTKEELIAELKKQK